jgi:hypothetical protein
MSSRYSTERTHDSKLTTTEALDEIAAGCVCTISSSASYPSVTCADHAAIRVKSNGQLDVVPLRSEAEGISSWRRGLGRLAWHQCHQQARGHGDAHDVSLRLPSNSQSIAEPRFGTAPGRGGDTWPAR